MTGLDIKAELAYARTRLFADRPAEVVALADRLLAASTDPRVRAPALSFRFAALINMRRTGEFATTMDAAFDAARAHPDPQWLAQAYALAAIVAQLDGSLERCVSNLVHSGRALQSADKVDENLPWAWHNLAMAYSYAGFPKDAEDTIISARERARTAGLPEANFVVPAIRLRRALALDHQGDTEGCLRLLKDIGADFAWHERAAGRAGMRPASRGFYGYAIARLAAFGEASAADAVDLLDSAGDTVRARDLRTLGRVCLAIGAGEPKEALVLLNNATVAPETLGPAEIPRLSALAYLAAGDHPAAYEADRRATRIAGEQNDQLRELLIKGMAARIDHEHLVQRYSRYAGEARTDPLTGLPNRRHMERYVTELVGTGVGAFVGICDLDGFKIVNSVHGHLSGDLVLKRVAGVLNRVVDSGDMVARFGGDEFVVVLPGATAQTAAATASRITAAVAAENWAALVPGTPVAITVGWAEIPSHGNILGAFEAADRAMLRAKSQAPAS